MLLQLTSLIGAAATLTALFGSFGENNLENAKSSSKVTLVAQPIPLAVLTVAILIGALLGVHYRVDIAIGKQTAQLRGLDLAPPSNLKKSIQDWTRLGLPNEVVTNRLFDAYIGLASSNLETSLKDTSKAQVAGVFTTYSEDCDVLRYLPKDKLGVTMTGSVSEEWAKVAELTNDEVLLSAMVNLICD